MNSVDDQARQQLLGNVNSLVDDLERYGSSIFTAEDDPDVPEPLDVEVKTSLDGSYRGAEILFTVGGPTIWATTNGDGSGTVYGSWGDDHFSRPFDADEELDDFIEQMRG